jgi:hypothetical protein
MGLAVSAEQFQWNCLWMNMMITSGPQTCELVETGQGRTSVHSGRRVFITGYKLYPMSLQMKFQGLCLNTELHNVSKRQVNIYYLEDVLKHASHVWRDVGHSFAALRFPRMFTAGIKHMNTAETRLSRTAINQR